jgi:hypothetical protein
MDLCIDSPLLAEASGETLILFFITIHRSVLPWTDMDRRIPRYHWKERLVKLLSIQLKFLTTRRILLCFQVTLASEGINL